MVDIHSGEICLEIKAESDDLAKFTNRIAESWTILLLGMRTLKVVEIDCAWV